MNSTLKSPSPTQSPRHFTVEEAREIGEKLGIDWSHFDAEEFRIGLDIEIEHGWHDPETDVTGNDPLLTGKIAWAHLKKFNNYYTRLLRCFGEDAPAA